MEVFVGIAVLLFMAGIVVASASRRRSDRKLGGAMVAGGLAVVVLAQLALSAG